MTCFACSFCLDLYTVSDYENMTLKLDGNPGVVTVDAVHFYDDHHEVALTITADFPFANCKVKYYSDRRASTPYQQWDVSSFEGRPINTRFFEQPSLSLLFTLDSPILNDYLDLFDNSSFADVTFHVDGEDIPAHKNILSARSPYFEAMFRSEMKENETGVVEIPNISADAFRIILRHVYGGALLPESDKAADLAACVLPKAHEYGLTPLFQSCVARMSISLNVSNVCHYFLLARLHGCTKLSSDCVAFMKQNTDAIISSKGWTTLGEQAPSVTLDLILTCLTG